MSPNAKAACQNQLKQEEKITSSVTTNETETVSSGKSEPVATPSSSSGTGNNRLYGGMRTNRKPRVSRLKQVLEIAQKSVAKKLTKDAKFMWLFNYLHMRDARMIFAHRRQTSNVPRRR
uniref:Uncharacterized protein n=1 Tax=Bracon brevicornis TaxID=1563983 RepID=A0A6V7MB00_9HYME